MGEEDTLIRFETRSKRKRRGGAGFTVVGVLLLVVGLACLGYIGYQYFGTNIVSSQHFKREKQGLREDWDAQPAAAQAETQRRVAGESIALLRIPRFGDDYEVPIMTGTDTETLTKGVGWYESSVRPGQIGNFALAGHRVTHGEPFKRLLEMKKGDEVIVETQDQIYTYVMDTAPADLTVQDTETWVLDPVPGKKGAQASQPLITLTTCQDLFHSPDRSVSFGHLAATKNK